MSTRITTVYGDDYHLYRECFEDDSFYLELEGNNLEFEIHPKSANLRIPNHVIQAILDNAAKIQELIKNSDSKEWEHGN
jgi:hypothetical protein